jgi:hypothetical protein
MPYVFYEELPEGMEEADVVERAELDSTLSELETAREQRDQAIERAESAEDSLRKSREKYANTFLKSPRPRGGEPEPQAQIGPTSISDLFKLDNKE